MHGILNITLEYVLGEASFMSVSLWARERFRELDWTIWPAGFISSKLQRNKDG
jgi:hypothetical protein